MTWITRTVERPASTRPCHALARLAAGAALLQLAVAADAATFRCTLTTGRTIVSGQNLAQSFPAGVESCVTVDEAAAVPAARLPGKAPRVLWAAPLDSATWTPGAFLDLPRWRAPGPPSAAGGSAYDELIAATSARHGVDPDLARAVMQAESAGKARALSNKGAIGLMQIMPGTGARYGVADPRDLYRPEVNIDAGIRYLRDLGTLFQGRLDLVVAAYNAGEGAVLKHGRKIPPYAETREYVKRVLGLYDRLVATRAGARRP